MNNSSNSSSIRHSNDASYFPGDSAFKTERPIKPRKSIVQFFHARSSSMVEGLVGLEFLAFNCYVKVLFVRSCWSVTEIGAYFMDEVELNTICLVYSY